MIIEKDIYLAPFTTFKIGGKADYFCRIKTVEDLTKALLFSRERNLPFFVLGGGSNILVSDDGFRGLVLKMDLEGFVFQNLDNKRVRLEASAAENWDSVVRESVEKELYGIENLSAIPGTIGATPIQNIGAYGEEVSNTIVWVEVFNTETFQIEKISNEECQFGYRHSIFKTSQGKKYIVLKVVYDLLKYGSFKIGYGGINEYFKDNKMASMTLKNMRQAIIDIRTRKLPDLNSVGTAGSFFKNPVINKEKSKKLRFLFTDIPLYSYSETHDKTSAAWLLDKVGKWKGVSKKNVATHDKQPIVLVNNGDSKASEVMELAEEIILDIKNKTGVELELEINRVGDFSSFI